MQPIREEELHAYIDGALSPGRRAEIEAYLAAHPKEAARAEAYRGQNLGLHALYSGRLDEAVPQEFVELASSIDRSLRRRRRGKGVLCWVVGSGLAAIMAATGWLARDLSVPNERQVTNAHLDFTRAPTPSSPLLAEGSKFVLQLSSFPHGVSLHVPDLKPLGFRLVEGQVLEDASVPTAQLVYRDDEGRIVTLYFSSTAGGDEIAPAFVGEGAVSQLRWRSDGFDYSVIGLIDRKRMLDIAQRTSRDLASAAVLRAENGTAARPAPPSSVDGSGSISEPADDLAPDGRARQQPVPTRVSEPGKG